MIHRWGSSLFLFSVSAIAHAAPQAVPAPTAGTTGGFLQVIMGLIVVLALMGAIAWVLKRFNLTKIAGSAPIKVVGGVSVGTREKVIVVEVADQWIVVGVATGRVNALSTMPRPAQLPAAAQNDVQSGNFGEWLKQKMDKRNGPAAE